MLYVLSIAVVLLAIGMVALFAMMGELYARFGGPGSAAPAEAVLDVEAKLGGSASSWPGELASLGTAPDGLLIVLSASCVSCEDVARELSKDFQPVPGYETAVALTASDAKRAEAFLAGHDLPKDRVFVDVGGRWVIENFEVQSSPSALVFARGALVSATVFTSVNSLKDIAGPKPFKEPPSTVNAETKRRSAKTELKGGRP
jgi:hypothetical protein